MTSEKITTIRNPILPGFNPDPSICRVGEDYYIATSTFEWYPGVQIHHSRDLVNWRLIAAAARSGLAARSARGAGFRRRLGALPLACRRKILARLHRRQAARRRLQGRAQLHRHGAGDRRAVVRSDLCEFKRLRSVALSRRRRPQMVPQHDLGPPRRAGNGAQASGLRRHPPAGMGRRPRGSSSARRRTIFPGSAHGLVEGPHLYKRNGWYYLTTAEGGTGYDHAVTMARSRSHRRPL